MNSTIIRAIELGTSAFVFLIALVNIIYSTTDIVPAFDEIQKSQENVYHVALEIPQAVTWSGAQVVGKLYRLSEDDVEIVVNGTSFKTDADVIKFSNVINKNGQFLKEDKFDTNGNLTMIRFTTY